jgi:hypothetical protein
MNHVHDLRPVCADVHGNRRSEHHVRSTTFLGCRPNATSALLITLELAADSSVVEQRLDTA